MFRQLLRQSGGQREIVSRPKCYACDTEFVTFEKGWDTTRADEDIYYWQDKSLREIDFVIRRWRDRVDVVECKINPDRLDTAPVGAFRALYPPCPT